MERLRQTCDWLNLKTLPGLCQLLKRLDISYKRGRAYVHSPDPHYKDKLSLIEWAWQLTKAHPEQ